MGDRDIDFPLLISESNSGQQGLRISAIWGFPEALRELGLDIADVLEEAEMPPGIFADRENPVSYSALARLFDVCAQRINRDDLGLLIGERTRLADLGLSGQLARCEESVAEGLYRFIKHYNLHDTSATMSLTVAGGYARFVWAIVEKGIDSTGHIQLTAMTIAFNFLQDLCGAAWLPTAVTVAARSPANPQECHRYFRAPVRFDSGESSMIFEQRWLDRPLPPMDPLTRLRIEAEAQARHAAIMADLPTTVRHILRKQLSSGELSMDHVAAVLGMHRRTLDRRLKQYGIRYSDVLESLQCDVARQLLRDTDLQIQQIAESLRYASAANFSTAFRRWTGVTPSAYRSQAPR